MTFSHPKNAVGSIGPFNTRRDIRVLRNDPVPVLARIIRAAHSGPSVGFMQPWDFILVSNDEVRCRIKDLSDRERLAAAKFFDEPRRSQYLSLKPEGIMEAPVNLCVTWDPTRAEEVLGRNSMPETDVYSTCCAVQNLWLAARSEGVGVGWVSILKRPQLRQILEIPPHIIPVAYLCLGYPLEFPKDPVLSRWVGGTGCRWRTWCATTAGRGRRSRIRGRNCEMRWLSPTITQTNRIP